MQHTNRIWTATLGASALCAVSLLAAPSGAETDASTVPSAWQHHKGTFTYSGYTTVFTCEGLGEQVRRILKHFGARDDLKVSVGGCSRGPSTRLRNAWVDVDFYALAPAAESAPPSAVQARWTGLDVTPRRPSFMGNGDCELIQGMKDVVISNFSLRGVDYRTSCTPNSQSIADFSIKAEGLIAARPQSG